MTEPGDPEGRGRDLDDAAGSDDTGDEPPAADTPTDDGWTESDLDDGVLTKAGARVRSKAEFWDQVASRREPEPGEKVVRSKPRTDGSRASARGFGNHSAEEHQWVIRTAESDQIPARTRLLTSWPLLVMYSRRQVQLRYRQSALGLAWTLIQPLAIMAIYGFIFTQFLQVDGGGDPYLAMAWTGLTIWMYVQAAVQSGTVALLNDAYMLGRVWFPREIIPLAPVVAGLIDLAMAAVVLVGVVAVQIGTVSLAIVTLPLMLYVLLVWVAAICVFTATITIFLRDVATLVGLFLRLMFIATPVMYPSKVVPTHLGWVAAGNPFAVVINNVRAVILGLDWPNFELLALHGAVGTGFLALSLWYLRSVERRMVDVI